MHIVFDHAAVFVGAVVIANDGAGTDIDFDADGSVTDLAQEIRFGRET